MSPANSGPTLPSVLRRLTVHTLRTLIAFGLAFICFEIVVWCYEPIGVWFLGVVGRSTTCTPTELFQGAQQFSRQRRIQEDILLRSHLVRSDSAYQLWQTRDGPYWIPTGTEKVLPILLAQQQVGIYRNQHQGVRPGNIVLDCGAHVGVYTLEALKRGASLVVAIEPAPSNLECLRRNVGSYSQVIIYPKGVWHEPAILPLYEDPDNSAADGFVISAPKYHVKHQIPLTTIDQIVQELKLSKVDIIKLDIKGAATRALQGALQTLTQHHPQLMISTEEVADNPSEIIEILTRPPLNYRFRCGSCSVYPDYMAHPDMLFFY